ncbi:MAG: hypothetical protein RL572_532 [Pseudomonadota bacterium]|jgi:hypothetical protein
MEIKQRIWLGLGIMLATSTAFYAGTRQGGMDHDMAVMTEEGGEGGEGATTVEAIDSTAAYLAQLSFIRGHLNVGVNLYRENALDASATHMKHPTDELYTSLEPALLARGAKGFAPQLEALAVAVEQQQGAAAVEAAYANLLEAISQAEAAVKDVDATTVAAVIVDLVRTAAAEFDIAVGEGGVLENEHEYQDALGFVRTASEWLPKLAALTRNADAVAAIETQIALLLPVWPGLRAPQRLETAPSVIYGAAARIEFAALKL